MFQIYSHHGYCHFTFNPILERLCTWCKSNLDNLSLPQYLKISCMYESWFEIIEILINYSLITPKKIRQIIEISPESKSIPIINMIIFRWMHDFICSILVN